MTPARNERRTALVPPVIRWPAALVALCCTVVLVALGIRYHGDSTGGRVDSWAFGQIPGLLRAHRRSLTWMAEALPVAMVLLAVVLAVVCALGRRWRFAVLAVLAPAITVALTELGKELVGRRIDSYLALPSGHTAGATSVLLVLGLIVLSRVRRHVRAAAAVVLAAVTAGAALVGLLMVSLHDHYATDTVAGYCLALAVTLATGLAIDSAQGNGSTRALGEVRSPAEAGHGVAGRDGADGDADVEVLRP